MDTENKEHKNSFKPVIIAVLFLFLGIYIGSSDQPEILKVSGIEGKETPSEIKGDFTQFWKVWNIIEEKYIPPNIKEDEILPEQERIWGAINGLVRSLEDPGTTFLLPQQLELFESDISGNFEGIGMEIGIRDDILTVIAPLKGTPAYRAGVKPGDKIFKIDGQEVFDMDIDRAVRLIRGEKGTDVNLVLFREDVSEPIELKIKRDRINIPTVDSEWLNGGDIFLIRLYNFSANSADLFRTELRRFVLERSYDKDPKIILDLRGNPGGFLEASVDIASWFLPVGKVIVREDFGGKREETIYRSKGYNIFGKNLKMAILIDEGSASASEILAGALKEHNVATLIGGQSFGKGSVQELIRISDNTSLKITIARWLTPDGYSLSLGGLTPDMEVEMTQEDSDANRDPVIDKAVEFLIK